MKPEDYVQKPPLGLMPEEIWVEKRIEAIDAAIDRYTDAHKHVPVEWVAELQKHSSFLKSLSLARGTHISQRRGIVDNPHSIYKSEIMNYKKFDIQKALAGEPVVCRNGVPVKISGYNPDAHTYDQVVGWVLNVVPISHSWNDKGDSQEQPVGPLDLFMAPVKKKGYAAIFPLEKEKSQIATFANIGIYDTYEEARQYAATPAIVISVEWEE